MHHPAWAAAGMGHPGLLGLLPCCSGLDSKGVVYFDGCLDALERSADTYIPVNPLPGVETNGLSDSRVPGLLF